MTNDEMTVLRLRAVVAMTGLARSTIYKLMSEGDFPRPIRLTTRCVGWRRRDVQAWIDARAQAAK